MEIELNDLVKLRGLGLKMVTIDQSVKDYQNPLRSFPSETIYMVYFSRT